MNNDKEELSSTEEIPLIRKPSLGLSLLPLGVLIMLLGTNVYFFGDDTLSGSNQIALLLAAAVAGIIAIRLGHDWKEIEKSVVKSISSAMSAILILFMIGALSGSWLISGVVPAMIFYGLKILNPIIFLFAACIVSAIVSLATGSSWSTIATVGVALLGIGKALGMGEGVIAGAIISGAYFGDKMSPLSDTTNLAPAMAGTDLFTHIRYMIYTTGPSILIALVIYLIWGFTADTGAASEDVPAILNAIDSAFNINPILFLVPAAVIFMIVKKVPALPALLGGTILGAIFALIFQPHLFPAISGAEGGFEAAYVAIMKSIFTKVSVVTDNAVVNDLLSTKGMAGMLNTIWLILMAMVFGGVMEASHMLQRIASAIITLAHSTGSLIASTAASCVFFNVTASDQYLAIVVPGRMFRSTYRDRGLKPEVLSRTLEDSGTVTSVLVPWNTCGATQASVLGVSTFVYAPFAFFNIISPFMTIVFGYLNIKIRRFEEVEEKAAA